MKAALDGKQHGQRGKVGGEPPIRDGGQLKRMPLHKYIYKELYIYHGPADSAG